MALLVCPGGSQSSEVTGSQAVCSSKRAPKGLGVCLGSYESSQSVAFHFGVGAGGDRHISPGVVGMEWSLCDCEN